MEQDLHIIITDCRSGSRKAQEQLFRQLYGFAMSVALRYSRDTQDAAAILSHSFVKVFKSIHSFDETKGTIQSWLKRIITNQALDHIKQRSRFSTAEIDTAEEPYINNAVIEATDAVAIMELIKQLPPATHAVFVLFALDGYSHKEIATHLGISEGTSKWHLSEARKNLQKKISGI